MITPCQRRRTRD